MKKLIIILGLFTSLAIANPVESSSLPIKNSFNLPKDLDLTAYRTMTTLMNPNTNQMELSIFSLKGGIPNFTGQIISEYLGKLQIRSVATNYYPSTKSTTPEKCNFNLNGTINCFHPNSLVLEDNNIQYQTNIGASLKQNKLDTGVMGAGIKFFAATNFESNGTPTKYLGITNDTYKQQLYYISCDNKSSCEQNKIKVKPYARTLSNFQILNNKLYFVVNYNTLVTIDITKNSYQTLELNVYNVSAFVLDKSANLYVMNSVGNIKDNLPGSFAVSKCSLDSGKCVATYTENSNPLRYSRLFMGLDENNIYLLANKDNSPLTLSSSLSLIAIPKK